MHHSDDTRVHVWTILKLTHRTDGIIAILCCVFFVSPSRRWWFGTHEQSLCRYNGHPFPLQDTPTLFTTCTSGVRQAHPVEHQHKLLTVDSGFPPGSRMTKNPFHTARPRVCSALVRVALRLTVSLFRRISILGCICDQMCQAGLYVYCVWCHECCFAFFPASLFSGTDNAPSLLTASTEGRVSTWNPSQLSQPLQDMRLT